LEQLIAMTSPNQQELLADQVANELANKLAALSGSFAHNLPGRLHELADAMHKCQIDEPNQANVGLLHRLLHSLAGSAGTFGFNGLGVACARIESHLRDLMDLDSWPLTGFAPVVSEIKELLRWAALDPRQGPDEASHHFVPAHEIALAGMHEPQPSPQDPADNRMLYVVCDREDPQLLAQLEAFGYRVQVFIDPAKLAGAFAMRLPAAVIVDKDTVDGIRELVQLQHGLAAKAPTLFLSANGLFSSRLAAVLANAEGFFVKPVNIAELNERIKQLVWRDERPPYRVLIIDDDVFITDFYSAILRCVGMEVHVLHDPSQIFDALAEYRPELLLMDVYMPVCSGVHLAKIIRQESMYLNVPIVFLSTESNIGKQLDAIQSGADDFLTKPMPAHHLVSSLSSRIERYRALHDLVLRDGLTRLYNHSTIIEQAALEFERAKRHSKPLALAMLDLDFFKQVNDTHGHVVGDSVIRSLAQLLQQLLRRVDVIGRYGGEEFAVIFPETTASSALMVLDKARDSFAKIQQQGGEGQTAGFSVTFSAGIVELNQQPDAKTLFEQADRALYAAKHAGRNCIKLFSELAAE
jgi:diguanylate cyclase (GGDEF)-like protein